MRSITAWMFLGFCFLIGCASTPADESDATEEGATRASGPESLSGKTLRYRFLDQPFEEPFNAFAGVRPSGDSFDVATTSFRLAPAEYTLTVVAATGDVDDIPAELEVPKNVVTGAVARFEIFSWDEHDQPTIVKTSDGLGMFETLTVKGDAVSFTSATVEGTKRTGSIDLPGLQSGERQYTFIALPRNVSKGSIAGTHFFEVKAKCVVDGCAAGMGDLKLPGK